MSAKHHTPGPWTTRKGNTRWSVVGGGQYIAYAVSGTPGLGPDGERANAERIVACVNACEGLADPAVVPELLAALKVVTECLESTRDCSLGNDPEGSAACDRARAAIAKAEGTEQPR